jgi:hypothetical protein
MHWANNPVHLLYMGEMRLKDGKGEHYRPKPRARIKCQLHGYSTTWNKLDNIQKLAVSAGIDTTKDLPCILEPKQPNPKTFKIR